MEDWKKQILGRILGHWTQEAKEAFETEPKWDWIAGLAKALGHSTQAALEVGAIDIAKQGYEVLMFLAKKILEILEAGAFPPEQWERDKAGWWMAVAVGNSVSRAAARGLKDMTMKVLTS